MIHRSLYLMVDRYVPHARMLSSSPFMRSPLLFLSVHSSMIRPLSSVFSPRQLWFDTNFITASPARSLCITKLEDTLCAWAPTAQLTTRAKIRKSFIVFNVFIDYMLICLQRYAKGVYYRWKQVPRTIRIVSYLDTLGSFRIDAVGKTWKNHAEEAWDSPSKGIRYSLSGISCKHWACAA